MWVYLRTELQEWQPWANTLIYMEFEQDISNLSWQQPIAYSTSWLAYEDVWWQYVVKATQTWRNIEYNPNIQSIWTGDFTVSCWYYPITQSSSQPILRDLEYNSSPWYWIIVRMHSWNQIAFFTSFDDPDHYSTVNLNAWNHIVMTRINGVCRWYVNGVKWVEFSSNTSLPTSNASFRVFSRTQYNQSQMVWAMWDKFIFEDIWWTDANVSAYYNQTKSIYWIS